MGHETHVGHQARGRYRSAQQIEHALARLGSGEFLVLECGVIDNCYAQVILTPEGVYEVEYREGGPERHYRTQAAASAEAAAVLAAWVGARPGWSAGFDWVCLESTFARPGPISRRVPVNLPEPNTRPTSGATPRGRQPLFHVAFASDWAAARELGEYRCFAKNANLDEAGFIRACFADQVDDLASTFFDDFDAKLVILVIDEDELPSSVGIEYAVDADDFFPHIRGPVPIAAVTNTVEIRPDPATFASWHWPYRDAWFEPVPDRVPITREPDYRTDLAGRYDDGLFLAGYCGSTYLHLFDVGGEHLWTWTALAEQALGENVSPYVLLDHVRTLLESLPGCEFGDIAVAPFVVTDAAGERWGLIDETVKHGFPHVELWPDWLGFNPPWNGLYDT